MVRVWNYKVASLLNESLNTAYKMTNTILFLISFLVIELLMTSKMNRIEYDNHRVGKMAESIKQSCELFNSLSVIIRCDVLVKLQRTT